MANYKQKDNSGAMFLNDRKTQENQPDYMGKVTIAGQVYYVSCWVKEPNDPDKKNYLSLAFSLPKKAQPQEVGKATGQAQTEPEQEQTPVTEGQAEEIVEVEEEDTEIPF